MIACSKLDEMGESVEKFAEILKNNTGYSLAVMIMEAPCCSGRETIGGAFLEVSSL